MPTFIKTGYWESAVKSYKGWLNLEDLISGIAISGSGTAGQIAFWTNTSVQSGSSNLVWDNTNSRLGIRSSAPTGNLEIKTANDLATLRAYPNDDSSSPLHLLRGNNGVVSINTFTNNSTITTPTDVSASGGITRITGNIYIGGAYRGVARMEYITTSIPAIGNPPTAIRFLTTDNSYSLNERAGITSNGNFQIGDSITTNRNSRLYVKSSGATAATWTAQFQNSALNNALVIDDAGSVMLGTATSSGERLQVNGTARVSGDLTALTFQGAANVQFQYTGNNTYVRLEETGSSSNGILFNVNNTTNSFKFKHNNLFSFTLGYGIGNGARGAWFGSNASLVIVDASAQVQIDSTTKGFLPPRMTNAQRTAISSPAVGLIVYCTDAVEGLYIYKSTGWTFVI
jgi:hypothetical protein